MELLKEFLSVALYAVITTAVPILVKGAWDWLKSVKEEKISNIKNESLQAAIRELSTASDNAVLTTFQTYVDSLKKSGEFNEEEHKKAFEMAKNTLMESLSIEAKEVLKKSYSNLDGLLTSFLESSVKVNKPIEVIEEVQIPDEVAKPQ